MDTSNKLNNVGVADLTAHFEKLSDAPSGHPIPPGVETLANKGNCCFRVKRNVSGVAVYITKRRQLSGPSDIYNFILRCVKNRNLHGIDSLTEKELEKGLSYVPKNLTQDTSILWQIFLQDTSELANFVLDLIQQLENFPFEGHLNAKGDRIELLRYAFNEYGFPYTETVVDLYTKVYKNSPDKLAEVLMKNESALFRNSFALHYLFTTLSNNNGNYFTTVMGFYSLCFQEKNPAFRSLLVKSALGQVFVKSQIFNSNFDYLIEVLTSKNQGCELSVRLAFAEELLRILPKKPENEQNNSLQLLEQFVDRLG